jgi:hypothetical protein
MADTRFTPLGGTSRKYIDALYNETISRREYYVRSGRPSFEQIKAVNVAKSEYVNPMAKYNILTTLFKESLATKEGYKYAEIKVRGDNYTANLLKSTIKNLRSKDNSATGNKANALITLGLREPEWTFAVGETPTEGEV